MKIGFYESDITPPLGIFMPGHGRWLYGSDVYDKIYAKAVAFESLGECAVIISVDSLCPTEDVYEKVTERITKLSGISKEHISLHFTHTHWGAPLYGETIMGIREDAAYVDVCYRIIADTAVLAYRRMTEAEGYFEVGNVEGIAFNRDYVMEDGTVITYGTNGKAVKEMFGPTDTSLPLIKFFKDGKPIGALINFALHQCCGDHDCITGDYSSVLSKKLKEKYGENFVSVFTAGTCGDINHLNTNHVPWDEFRYREIGEIMANEVIRMINGNGGEAIGEGISLAEDTVYIDKRMPTDEYTRLRAKELIENDKYYANINSSFLRIRSLVLANSLYSNPSAAKQMPLILKAFKIGNVCLYSMPGEVFVKFGLRLKKESPIKNSIVLELSNSLLGYVPTPESFGENCDLYEANLTYKTIIPEGGDIMVDKLLLLGEKLIKGENK